MGALDIGGLVVVSVMVLGPLALAPAYGPYVEPGTATEVTAATAPLQEGSAADTDETGVATSDGNATRDGSDVLRTTP